MARLLTVLFVLIPLLAVAGERNKRRGWPGKAWTTAKAYTFNWRRYGPPAKWLHIYEEPGGLNGSVRNHVDLTEAQANAAFDLVKSTEGEMLMSKCAFPRHGVVFYDKDNKAVGSVSVCFGCGDILVWPPYAKRPSRKKVGKDGVYTDAFLKRFDIAMKQWEALFKTLPDMPPKWHPTQH